VWTFVLKRVHQYKLGPEENIVRNYDIVLVSFKKTHKGGMQVKTDNIE
jgi:hypothetical protein